MQTAKLSEHFLFLFATLKVEHLAASKQEKKTYNLVGKYRQIILKRSKETQGVNYYANNGHQHHH